MRITKKKAAAVIAISTVAMAGAGGAFAYWTTGGTGSGSAEAGENANFTIAQTNTVDGLVLNVAKTVNFTVTNPATFPQYLTGVDVTVVPFSAQADVNKPACTAGDFSISNIAISAGEIVANNGTRTGTASVTLVNKPAANQDNCKLAPIALSFVAS